MQRSIIFVIPPGVHVLDINGPAQIFYEAKEYGADLALHFVSPLPAPTALSSAGLQFSNLTYFSELTLGKRDIIIVPGIKFQLLSDRHFLKKLAPFFSWLNDQQQAGALICSVCTGTFLLAEAGLLQQRSCTTHWKRIPDFQQRFPDIKILSNRLFVMDDQIWTSAGISSGIDLALYILEQKFSPKLAAQVAKEAVVYFRRGESDPQLSIYLQFRNHLDERIHEAQTYILEHLGQSFNHDDIAMAVNMSVRNLTRQFKKATGLTIHQYTQQLRIERARKLLAENNTIEMVAASCGFKSVSQLHLLLKKYDSISRQ